MLKIQVNDKSGLKELAENFSSNVKSRLDSLGDKLRTDIITRTQGGTDANGQSFAPYRPFTVAQKIKKGQQISPVNLMDSGEMLASIQSQTENNNEIVIKITAKEQVATELQTGRSDMQPREFFALDDAQVDEIVEKVLDFI
jgi:hypothetical protein